MRRLLPSQAATTWCTVGQRRANIYIFSTTRQVGKKSSRADVGGLDITSQSHVAGRVPCRAQEPHPSTAVLDNLSNKRYIANACITDITAPLLLVTASLKPTPGVRHDTTRYSSSYSRRDATTWRARVERAEATRDVAERPHFGNLVISNSQKPEQSSAIIGYQRKTPRPTSSSYVSPESIPGQASLTPRTWSRSTGA